MAKKAAATEKVQSAAAAEPFSWDDMREIRLPRAGANENKSVYVCINGREFMVPCGKVVTVPYPVYERLKMKERGLELVEQAMEEIPNEV